MKRAFTTFLAICFCLVLSAQRPRTPMAQTPGDTTNREILRELKEIHQLQDEARTEARADRDSIRKVYMNIANQHKADSAAVPSDEYEAMLTIADNTHQDPIKDGWNVYGWVAFVIALASALIGLVTFRAQKRTEGNTKKLSQDAQRKLLDELLRHLYRNYVITYTMRTKMKDIDYKGYPSEEHFEKLKIPMENIHLDAFYGEDEKFQRMHVLYLNMRNYNQEVDVALKHVIDRNIRRETKDEDFDTLEFKVSFLTGKIIDTIQHIWGDGKEYLEEMRNAMKLSLTGETNATKNIDVPGSDKFEPLKLESLKNTAYARLYSEEELEKVCAVFNEDVHEERKKNARGAWKVRMIRYDD